MVNAPHTQRPIDFQGRDAREQFQFYFRQHWVRMVAPLARAILYTALIGILGYITLFVWDTNLPAGRHLWLTFFFFFLCVVQLEFLVRFYRYFLHIVIVTDHRIHVIKKTLLMLDEHESIDLHSLQEIHKAQHGLVQNLLGFGTLILEAQDTQLRLHFTPNIGERYNELMHLRREAKP